MARCRSPIVPRDAVATLAVRTVPARLPDQRWVSIRLRLDRPCLLHLRRDPSFQRTSWDASSIASTCISYARNRGYLAHGELASSRCRSQPDRSGYLLMERPSTDSFRPNNRTSVLGIVACEEIL